MGKVDNQTWPHISQNIILCSTEENCMHKFSFSFKLSLLILIKKIILSSTIHDGVLFVHTIQLLFMQNWIVCQYMMLKALICFNITFYYLNKQITQIDKEK